MPYNIMTKQYNVWSDKQLVASATAPYAYKYLQTYSGLIHQANVSHGSHWLSDWDALQIKLVIYISLLDT